MIPQCVQKIKHNPKHAGIFWRERVMLMTNGSICCIRRSAAISHAFTFLAQRGLSVTAYPTRSTRYLLLPVPSFPNGSAYLEELLPSVSKGVIICGGNLDTPLLKDYRTVDFLKDPYYLAENAAITAECALAIAEDKIAPAGCSALVLGWGRIGKCLGRLLQLQGADVTIAARRDADLAMIRALGCESVQIENMDSDLTRYSLILNTIPAMVLPGMITAPDTVILELASQPGMAGENIISARGLPGKMAPEASGKLIADTFVRLLL